MMKTTLCFLPCEANYFCHTGNAARARVTKCPGAVDLPFEPFRLNSTFESFLEHVQPDYSEPRKDPA